MPLFSIIIPTYNRANMITSAIESVLAQDFDDFEIVVSDDCSKDNTEELVKSYINRDTRVKYFKNNQNYGQIKNMRNAVDNYAKGKWVLFLNDDDYYEKKESLSLAATMIAKNPDLNLIFIEHCIDNNLLKFKNYPKSIPEVLKGREYLKSIPWDILNFIIKKEKFLEYDFYNGSSFFSEFEVTDLSCMRMEKVGYLKEFVLVFRIGEQNLNKFKTNIKDFVKSISYLKRPYLYALKNKIFTKEELNDIYFKRFEEYNLKIVVSIVGDMHKELLRNVYQFYIKNIEDEKIDFYLEEISQILESTYQSKIDEKVNEYKEHLKKINKNYKKLDNMRNILIYGTGLMGEDIYTNLKDKKNILGFIDDFTTKKDFMNKPIIQLNSFTSCLIDGIVLATNNYSFICNMTQNLVKNGIEEEKILCLF